MGTYAVVMSVSPGKLVYVAGQVGVDSDRNLVGKGDAAAQTRQALQNIGLVVAGLVSEDYLVEIKAVAALP